MPFVLMFEQLTVQLCRMLIMPAFLFLPSALVAYVLYTKLHIYLIQTGKANNTV